MLKKIKSTYRSVVPKVIRRKVYKGRQFFKADMNVRTVNWETSRRRGPPLFSMILASYNVAPYLDRFLESILTQKGSLADLELIFVNDGSIDNTSGILQRWAERYPNLIVIIDQENGGAAAARNTGLDVARGKWISFPDPDDFLDRDYLQVSRKAVMKIHDRPLTAVCTKLVFYFEDKQAFRDSHPLNFRFAKPSTTLSTQNMGRFIHLSGATIWLRSTSIEKNNIRFTGHGWGTFEDAHFINRVLIDENDALITFVSGAKYFYRQRSDSSSLVGTAKNKKAFYIEQLRDGTLDLAVKSHEKYGLVPSYIQRTMLYEIFSHVKLLQQSPDFIATVLDRSEQQICMDIIKKNFQYIDKKTIEGFNLSGCYEEHKVALLGLFKGMRRSVHTVYLNKVNVKENKFEFIWYCGGMDHFAPAILVNGQVLDLPFAKKQTKHICDQPYFTRNGVSVELGPYDQIQFLFDDEPALIRTKGKVIAAPATGSSLQAAVFKPRPLLPNLAVNSKMERLREVATSAEMLHKFHNCWILMDSIYRADDNAEHLYRHLMKQPEFTAKIWFVLDRMSHDWDRLANDGFHLLAYQSDEHIAAQINAELLASSHADEHVLWPVEKEFFEDLVHYNFVFLQHGVIVHDLSKWLNTKQIEKLVTSSKAEYDSVASPESPYVFTSDQVILTGLARHDALLKKAKKEKPDSILIMPTWRRNLLELVPRNGQSTTRIWSKTQAFAKSDFFRYWNDLISDPRLVDIAARHKRDVIFAPHPNMSPYIEDFDIPDTIKIFDPLTGGSYQDLFARGQMLVTDYSSVAFEMAYIERKVAYFQFDANALFDGSHLYQQGYFNYERDGFGPVSNTASATLNDIEKALNGNEDTVYATRRKDFFPYRDGKCCQRIQAAIESAS